MRTVSRYLAVAATLSGAGALALMLGGWLGLVPYALILAGVLYLTAATAGFMGGQ